MHKKASNEPITAYQEDNDPPTNAEFKTLGLSNAGSSSVKSINFDSDLNLREASNPEVEDAVNWGLSVIQVETESSDREINLDPDFDAILNSDKIQSIADSCSSSKQVEEESKKRKKWVIDKIPEKRNFSEPKSRLVSKEDDQGLTLDQFNQGCYQIFEDPDSGIVYKGLLTNGLMNGFGESRDPRGGFYSGYWKNGLKTRQGEYHYPNGTVYRGEWFKNQWHGEGVLTTREGGLHQGEFMYGLPSGYGFRRYPNKDFYEGEWFIGKRSGLGVFQHSNGAFYTGEWKDDLPNGFGEFHSTSGCIYRGEFLDGMMHGEGELFSRRYGFGYRGCWRRGFQDGYGVFEYSNGKMYEGKWRMGKKHGKGVIKIRTREIREVDHIDGLLLMEIMRNQLNS